MIGQTLSHYRITATLGAGGMGEVYRATDTNLGRDVALKVLPPEVTEDAERLARFRREAHLLASLNHPNIAAIYGLEEADGKPFLAMELVEGEDLKERLERGPIPPDEALAVARQIAEALEEAHENGIVHRDLKPANVKLTPEGKVKVLDFGLAKAWGGEAGPGGSSSDLSQSPTLAHSGTRAGVILGTAAYMAPEQARGKAVDKRADIWAFGVVLFEMLSGTRLFEGETVSDVLASVLKGEPDWGRLPADTPTGVGRLLRRCLDRDPRRRLRDIGDARWELEIPTADERSAVAATPRRSRWGVAALVALAALTTAVAVWILRGPEEIPPLHLSIALPEGHALTSGPAISADGQVVAFTSTDGESPSGLYVRGLTEALPRRLPGTDEALYPFFSPDGRSLGFFARGALWRTDTGGGTPLHLAAAPVPAGGTWGDDDTIVFVPTWNGGLYRVRAGGGQPELLLAPEVGRDYACVLPHFLPGSGAVLFSAWGEGGFTISRLSLPGLERAVLADGWTSSIYLPPGFLIFGDGEGGVRAQPYRKDPGAELTVPASVLEDVYWDTLGGSVRLAVSRDGTLAYAPGDPSQKSLVRVDLTGRVTPLSSLRAPYQAFAASPDGTRMAVVYRGRLWVQDLRRGSTTPLLPEWTGAGAESLPLWTPDGERIVFSSNRGGNWDLYERDASGAGPIRTVLEREFDQHLLSIAPDGTLAFGESRPGTGNDIGILRPDGTAEAWLSTAASEWGARFSPDGHWLAYSSDQSGRDEVYVQSLRDAGRRAQVSTSGGDTPAWSKDGRRLFFRQGHRMMGVAVTLAPRLDIGTPEVLFDGGWPLAGDTRFERFEVTPDGSGFFMLYREPAAIPSRIDVVLGWDEQVRSHVEPGDRP